jgi:hypothetical protein
LGWGKAREWKVAQKRCVNYRFGCIELGGLRAGELGECVCVRVSFRIVAGGVPHHWAWERGPLTSVLVFQEITAALFPPAGTQAAERKRSSLSHSRKERRWFGLVWFGCVQTDRRTEHYYYSR